MSVKEQFKVESIADLQDLLTVVQGGDPNAQQLIKDFADFKSLVERSNFPTQKEVHLSAFLDYAGKILFPDNPENPFSVLRDTLAVAFMARKGWKSNSFVEMVKQTPSLAELFGNGDVGQPKSWRERLLGGRGSE